MAVSGTIVDVVASQNNTRAFVLTKTGSASFVYAIDLATGALAQAAPLSLPGGATALAVGPTGWIYMTATNRFYEIDGSNLTVRSGGEFPLFGSPSRPVFTPDGHYALMANTTGIGNAALFLVDLITRGAPDTFPPSGIPNNVPTIDKVMVVNNNRFLVFTSQATSIYEGTFSPFNLAESPTLGVVTNIHNVVAAAASNEVPQAKYLYIVISNGVQSILQRIDLPTNSINSQTNVANNGNQLQFAFVPTTASPTTIQQLGDNQIIPAGTKSGPIVVRITDAAGRPVSGVPVVFATTAEGATLAPTSATTGIDGFAGTIATAPATPGAFQITATASGIAAPATFSLSVPGSSGGGGGGPSAGGIFIYSGDGQLLLEGDNSSRDMVVIVRDGDGKPVPGVEVTFSVAAGQVGVIPVPVTTDSDGLASTFFKVASVQSGQSFSLGKVTASSSYGDVTFVLTVSVKFLIGGGAAPVPTLEVVTPTLDTNRTVILPAGSTMIGAVKVRATSLAPPQAGQPIPNVGMRLELSDTGKQIACANKPVPLTDSTGLASCDVVAPCTLGFSNMNIYVGEFFYFPGGIQVTTGTAAKLQILTGNNQTGTVGQPLPLGFLAIVTDSCGTPLSGQAVTWKIASGSGTLTQVVSTSDSSGRVSARLTLGNTAGAVQVTVSTGPISAIFAATVNVTVGSITPISGAGQVANVNQTFGQQLVVQVNDNQGNPLGGFPVTFAPTAGSASVSPSTVTTSSNGRASTSVTAGGVAGNIVITATAGSFTTTFGLTSRVPGPSITASSFQNAASFQVGLTPCGLATVTGSGLAAGIQGTVLANQILGPLPYILAGVEISVNGIPAPIFSVSNVNGKEQVSFQTPCEAVTSANGTVVARVNGSSTTTNGVLISAYQPGLFVWTASSGVQYAVVLKEDGSYVTTDNPAHRGDKLRIIVTGIGQTNPALVTNRAGIAGQAVAAPIIVGVNGAGVNVISAETLPGAVGVYTIVFQVPADAPLNDTKVIAAVGVANGLVFGNESNLPIR
ncbi:MAG: Ig-like domain-containing protein [Bryobacteraceae bacterium]